MLFDAHNHLQDAWLEPHLEAIATDLAGLPLAGAVVNGTAPIDWPIVSALAARFPWIIPSYGVHPWDCGDRPSDWQEQFVARLTAEPHAAVGEIGIDRWILDSARPDDPRLAGVRRAPLDEQIEVFRWQLDWATRHNRPVTIHCLQAWGPLIDLLRAAPALPRRGFLLHAYGGSAELVPVFAALGAYFSFNTAFIDPRKTRQRAAFRVVPADRLLAETDAPAMPPPHPAYLLPAAADGSSINHPANLALAYRDLASLREVPFDALVAQLATNFSALFQSCTATDRNDSALSFKV